MEINLATRGLRFGAYFIDSLILGILISLPSMLSKNVHPVIGLIWLLAFLGFIVYQAFLLTKTGQTIGKKVVNIKIIKINTNKNGGFVTNVIIRSLLYGPITFFVAMLIYSGSMILRHTSVAFFYNFYFIFKALEIFSYIYILLGFVDILFIFRKDKRCLHDFIARTCVIR